MKTLMSSTIIGLIMVGWLISPTNALAKTIFVPEDFATIQEAVNAADEDGDKILVGPGEYAGALILDRLGHKRIEIIGKGAVINAIAPRVFLPFPFQPPFGFSVIGDFRAPAGTPSDVDGTTISHFTFKDVPNGVQVVGANNISITHNKMGDLTLRSGIIVNQSRGSLVSHNVITDMRTVTLPSTFVTGGSGIGLNNSEKTTVLRNKIILEDIERGGFDSDPNDGVPPIVNGIVDGGGSENVISQNKITMDDSHDKSCLMAIQVSATTDDVVS